MSGGVCDGCHPPMPGERPTMDLGAEELFVVGALRAWVAPLQAPSAPHPDWREIMGLASMPAGAAVAFDLFMTVVAQGARRLLDVRHPPCTSLGEAELGMLRLITALQRGDQATALDLLEDWLTGEAVPAALRAAERFAELAAEGGMRLPAAPPPPRFVFAPSPTLH